jgi:hypothetical protein
MHTPRAAAELDLDKPSSLDPPASWAALRLRHDLDVIVAIPRSIC